MLYQHSIDHCFEAHANHGVTRPQLDTLLAQLAPSFKKLAARKIDAATPLLELPSRVADLAEIETLAIDIRKRFKHIVVAGTGGSGLSGRTLTELAPQPSTPVFSFLENIDPEVMDALLARIDCERSCFLIISKSGSTVETLSQFYVLLDHVMKKLGQQAVRERFIIVTMPGDSPLRRSAATYGLRVLDHDTDIGGRFSVLTNVGLLPAAIAGLDIRALRRGAQSVVKQLDAAAEPASCIPAVGAALQYAFVQKDRPISVMLPYSERLAAFSSWYRQGWAESLGKQGRGSTPIRAVGTTDQHSQLQLYLDGPKDKLFHMILLDRARTGRLIPVPDFPELAYLRGKTMGDVMEAEQRATLASLTRQGCPVRLFTLNKLNEEVMGALLMHFMLEIICASFLFEVNPFDQPAVEEGKHLAVEYLLGKG